MKEPSQYHSLIQEIDSKTSLITFQAALYSSAAVKKAAYKFASDFSVVLSLTESQDLCVQLLFSEVSQTDKENLVRAFLNEVLDQDLREQIFRETEGTRNLILAEAFSRTSLLHDEG